MSEPGLILRKEQAADTAAIGILTELAFRDAPHGNHTEHLIVAELRDKHAITLSLVAEEHGQIVGHILFSPVDISGTPGGWHGLGPVSVLPSRQGKGIGSRLVEEGLLQLRACGSDGCVVLGEPAFYQRFGFANLPGCRLEGVPPEYFMCLAFGDLLPGGPVTYHSAFQAGS